MYDFLIDLLNEKIDIKKAVIEQSEVKTKINEPGNFVLLEEESINKDKSGRFIKKAKPKTQRRKVISSQKSLIKNAIKLYDERTTIINTLISKNIYPGNLKEYIYQDKEPKHEESIAETTKTS